MARVCELTGKNPLAGNNVSHSNNKVRRRFLPNLCNVSLISDAMGLTYRFRVSANALKTVEHRGGPRCVSSEGRQRRTFRQGPQAQELDCQEAAGKSCRLIGSIH